MVSGDTCAQDLSLAFGRHRRRGLACLVRPLLIKSTVLSSALAAETCGRFILNGELVLHSSLAQFLNLPDPFRLSLFRNVLGRTEPERTHRKSREPEDPPLEL